MYATRLVNSLPKKTRFEPAVLLTCCVDGLPAVSAYGMDDLRLGTMLPTCSVKHENEAAHT